MLHAEVGDIQLILPENFSGEFQTMVENAYSSDAIESEFPITIIKTMDDILDAVRYAYMMRRFSVQKGDIMKPVNRNYRPQPLKRMGSQANVNR